MSVVKISNIHRKKLKLLAAKFDLSMGRFVELSIDHFEKFNENPAKPTSISEVRNTTISFFRTQENNILLPMQKDLITLSLHLDLLLKEIKILKTNSVTIDHVQKILDSKT